jgi:ubiquinone/menaquinone biosynthesis C-methylase UbiE
MYAMTIFQKIERFFSRRLFASGNESPHAAYNEWAKDYDSQPDNLMLALDEEVFSALLNEVDIANSIVADIGCGTGRHWKKMFESNPRKLIGFDVSEGMLKMLRHKFVDAETYLLINDKLRQLTSESCDIVISTLTIAHIKNADAAIAEWNRILKPGGYMIITDYHPSALQKGAKRTFKQNNKTVVVRNYIHTLANLRSIARQLHLQECRLIEREIDESAKAFYEKNNALDVFKKWEGTPIIYGMCLKKPDAVM